MANPNISEEGKNTRWQPGESGNPAGKPKGAVHLSTHIRNMLNDPEFELYLEDIREGYKKHDGVPIQAIIKVAITKAAAGDDKAREWLAKYGYGQKFDITSDDEPLQSGVVVASPELAAQFLAFMQEQTKADGSQDAGE